MTDRKEWFWVTTRHWLMAMAGLLATGLHGQYRDPHAPSPSIKIYQTEGHARLSCPKQEEQLLAFDMGIPFGCRVVMDADAQILFRNPAGDLGVAGPFGRPTILTLDELNNLFDQRNNAGLLEQVMHFLSDHIRKKSPPKARIAEYHLRQRGGVTRGDCPLPLMRYPGYGATLISGQQRFVWRSVEGEDEYLLQIHAVLPDGTQRALVHGVVSDTFAVVRIPANDHPEGTTHYRWLVQSARQDTPVCFHFPFRVVSENERDEIHTEIRCRTLSPSDPTSRLLDRAALFEQAGLLDEAEADLRRLAGMHAGHSIADFHVLYLLRTGMWETGFLSAGEPD